MVTIEKPKKRINLVDKNVADEQTREEQHI